MAEIVKFPVEKVHERTVRGYEVWEQPEPSPEMVWAVCPYTRGNAGDYRCTHCPSWEVDPDYGQVRRGCYAIAAEVCRVVFAMQKREARP